jgi:hypothetical protein
MKQKSRPNKAPTEHILKDLVLRGCAVGSGATACGISGAYELSRWNDPVGGVTLDSERAIDVLSKAPRNLYGGRSGLVALGSSAAARFILDHAGCEALVSQF